MSVKYIFIDIDGTLLSHTTGIPKSALEAIDLARRRGHKVFINTGRVKSAVDGYLQFYPFDGYVFAAGGHVMIHDETLYENIIPQDEIKRVIKVFEDKQVGYVLEGPEYSYYNQQAIDYFRIRLKGRKKLPPQVTRHLDQENTVLPMEDYYANPDSINKFSVFTEENHLLYEIEQALLDNYEHIIYTTASEIITKGINKFFGVQKVLDYYGADVKDSIALGDSMNDYPMIKNCGIGIAMGNAVDELKAVADYTTFDCEDNGLYHAFKKFGLID